MRPTSRLQNQSVGERAIMRDQNPCNDYTNQPTDDDSFAFGTPVAFTASQYNLLPPGSSILQGPTPKDSPTLPDSRYSTPLRSYAEALKHAKTPSPLSREYILPPKGRQRPQPVQQTQNRKENLAQIYDWEKLEREREQTRKQELLVDEDALINQYWKDHPSLAKELPPRFGFPTPPEIPSSAIIPAPSPFFTPCFAPQPTQSIAFKPWAQTPSPIPDQNYKNPISSLPSSPLHSTQDLPAKSFRGSDYGWSPSLENELARLQFATPPPPDSRKASTKPGLNRIRA